MAPRKKSGLTVVGESGALPRLRQASESMDDEPMSVTDAAASGSQLDLLVALRARVAVAVEDVLTPARDLAALSRRLQDISKEIEAIRLREKQEAETKQAEGQVDETFDPQAV